MLTQAVGRKVARRYCSHELWSICNTCRTSAIGRMFKTSTQIM
ncbi:hypothetical protein F383_31630 [Gossypium arboreum]|uniref:Uncharacterized protein n=1 Tax=Gossypium arboreum TaxID=29729 RepID=A0A0B0MH76_GOSAR|nr:hypothetical protein F383_20443 [Gossypium arboreum]KHG05350.1 hypothetical protein F383_31630 [Gossypium arboreum]